jgi:hypothetical protein
LIALLFAAYAAGCVSLVPPFDQTGVTRITELSKKSLTVYQTLIDTKASARPDALLLEIAKTFADLQTDIRVHLVFEQARENNSGSIDAAKQLASFWENALSRYCKATTPDVAPTLKSTGSRQATSATAADNPASGPPASISKLCAGKGVNDTQAMVDFVLIQDRASVERILGAMVKAEEAKKLAVSASK